MQRYAGRFEPQPEGGFTATFSDIPEAITQGETIEEARAMAGDALAMAFELSVEDRRPLLDPSAPLLGEEMVGAAFLN